MYKKKLFSELDNGQLKLSKFQKDFIRPAFQAMEKRTYTNPETGAVQYENKRGRGIKHDLLRSVQYPVAKVIFKAIQNKTLSVEQTADIPQTVLKRIKWLQENSLIPLSQDEVSELSSAYTQASIWYAQLNGHSQKTGSEKIELSLPKEELQKVFQIIQTIIRKML
jgi:hypothetical protein